jgi:hypothetical protein
MFYRTWRFVTVFTTARWSQTTFSHPVSPRYILILFSHPGQFTHFPSASFLQVFRVKFRTHFSSLLCLLHAPSISSKESYKMSKIHSFRILNRNSQKGQIRKSWREERNMFVKKIANRKMRRMGWNEAMLWFGMLVRMRCTLLFPGTTPLRVTEV